MANDTTRRMRPAARTPVRLRTKLMLGFGVLLSLMALSIGWTLFNIGEVGSVARDVTEHRQPAAVLALEMAEQVNRATSLLNAHLLTGDSAHVLSHNELVTQIRQTAERLGERLAVAGDAIAPLQEAQQLLRAFQDYAQRLFYLRAHTEENDVGMAYATERLLPLNLRVSGKLNELIIAAQDLDFGPSRDRLLRILYQLRYTWLGVLNSVRMALATHTTSETPNYHIYMQTNDSAFQQLLEHADTVDQLVIGALDSLQKARSEYKARLPGVLKLFQEHSWRADIVLMREEVQPLVERLQARLREIADFEVNATRAAAGRLNASLLTIRNANASLLLVSLAVGLLISVVVSAQVTDGLQRLMQGAKQVARGNLNVQIDSRTRDEVAELTTIFNQMVQRLNRAAQRETEHRQALTDMNQALEERVAKRTSELQAAQEQLLQSEKLAGIGQLAAGVAHEINNPVGYISSNVTTMRQYLDSLFRILDAYEQAAKTLPAGSELLERLQVMKQEIELDYLREDLTDLINESQEGVQRVKQIVQDLKDFSHVNEDEWAMADLHQGIESTLNIVHNEIKYKAELIKDYGDLPKIECVQSQLNQVFMNLVVNAAHAIEERGTITIRTRAADADWVWVEVSDTGCGIRPEHIKKLFEPFFTTKPVGKGTGLGLALSYGIVNKHRGRLDVQSEPGQGTTFRVWLPVTQSEDAQQQQIA